MPWLRDGSPQADTGFTVGEVNYPSGWIANNPQAEREKLNITFLADSPAHDQRFSWGWNSDGSENWKDLADLKPLWKSKQTQNAKVLLRDSDWLVIRKQEAGTAIPTAWSDYRTALRSACNERESQIDAASTAAELKAIVTGPVTVIQNKKDSDGNDIEVKQSDGSSYDPKRYEHETVANTGSLDGKNPWPNAPTS